MWSTMMFLPLSLLVWTLLAVPTNAASCPLCSNNGQITCASTILRDDGQTCAGMANELSSLNLSGDEECEEYQVWDDACCDLTTCPPDLPPLPAPSSATAPAMAPTDLPDDRASVAAGPHPPCHLCRDGSFPGSPYTLINLLGYGEGTCQNWYYYALEGNVVNHQCDALMYFAYEPCGCGQVPNKPPTPRPTNRPTRSPYSTPVRKTPDESKEHVRLSNTRGGSGGAFHGGRRHLKGSKPNNNYNYYY